MTELKPARSVPCAHCGGTGSVALPPEIETIEAYYFGCWEHSGHYWRSPNGYTDERKIEARIPEALRHGRVDSTFCPGYAGPYGRRSCPEVEGEAAIHLIEGWTVLAWWDRSVDSRPACNSALVVRGDHSFTTMLEVAKAQMPELLKRQRFPVRLVAVGGGNSPVR
jgi:hypothetical protein